MARKTYTLKFHFNPKAAESLAKELRRASWGIAVAAAAGGMKAPESAAWVIVGSAIIWAIPVASSKNLSERCFVASRKNLSQIAVCAEYLTRALATAPSWPGFDLPRDRLRQRLRR
jgi:hypothetical protein